MFSDSLPENLREALTTTRFMFLTFIRQCRCALFLESLSCFQDVFLPHLPSLVCFAFAKCFSRFPSVSQWFSSILVYFSPSLDLFPSLKFFCFHSVLFFVFFIFVFFFLSLSFLFLSHSFFLSLFFFFAHNFRYFFLLSFFFRSTYVFLCQFFVSFSVPK